MLFTAAIRSIHDDLRSLMITRAIISQPRCVKCVKASAHGEKRLLIFPSCPLHAFLFSLVIFSPLDRLIDNPRRRREHFSRLLHHRCILGGFARGIIQSRELEAAGISAGCRPSWWGSKDGEGKISRYHAINTIFSCRRGGAIFCACCATWCNIVSPRTRTDLMSSPST